MKKLILLSCLLFITAAVHAQSCNDLPSQFNSYNEAVSKVEKATFKIKDKVDCNRSSWILKATYNSCDGETGFFILYLRNGKDYTHKDMPLFVWKEFKNTSDRGSYYSRNIKGKYQFKM